MSQSGYTSSTEDYLKAIFELSRGSGEAASSEVAARLGVTRASVSGMARRLAEQGLVKHERYGALVLTRSGKAVALRLLRRHRVIESYLVTALGFTWDRVHEEAERLEHTASDELVDRMAAAIGEPEVDPHGAPIPSSTGAMVERSLRSLDALAVGEEAKVARVEDHDPDMLRYLASLDLLPGAVVVCLGREPFGGPMSIRVGEHVRLVGPALAAQVLVTGR